MRLLAACGFALVVLVYSVGLGTPVLFDEPNDAQYAEVAREMLVSGDWISPQLNFVLFLNKPPLLYWLIASSYTAFGVSEAAARLPGLIAVLLTVVALYRLGTVLFDRTTGLIAAALFAALPSTFTEARLVRPDSLIMLTTICAVLAFVRVARSAGPQQTRACLWFQVALALGLLSKGMVALILPAMPIAALIALERRSDLLRLLLHPRSWWLFTVIIVPWHAVAVWRHTGFFWDYVVNQHLLFFLDRKEPRDSIPIPLALFWVAVVCRLFPWTLTVVPAFIFTLTRAARDREQRTALLIPLTLAGGTLLFFSLTVSRLEHYALPAIPAITLFIAVTLRQAPMIGGAWSTTIRALYLSNVAVLVAVALLLPGFLANDEWLHDAPGIVSIPGPYFGIFALTWLCATFLAIRASTVAVLLTCAICLFTTPYLRRGFALFAPINSSAPVADVIRAVVTPETHIVFEAPIEYQAVAGLNFYLQRPLTLLRPKGFVEPTYLIPYRDALFIERDQLADLWQREDVILISDPLGKADRPVADVAPAPQAVVAHIGNRWIVRNR